MAKAALFFSLLALAMSGFVLFHVYDDGRLVKNWRILTGETSKVIDSARKNLQERRADGLQWDKVRERIDRIETMVRAKDGRASYYIDVLKTDLELVRDYAGEKSSAALTKTLDGLEVARGRLSEDAASAAQKLGEVSKDLASKAKEFAGDERQEGEAADAGKGRRDSSKKSAESPKGT